MSGKELSRLVAGMRKRWIVRVTNGVTEHTELLRECRTRKEAERLKAQRERDGFSARIEVKLVEQRSRL